MESYNEFIRIFSKLNESDIYNLLNVNQRSRYPELSDAEYDEKVELKKYSLINEYLKQIELCTDKEKIKELQRKRSIVEFCHSLIKDELSRAKLKKFLRVCRALNKESKPTSKNKNRDENSLNKAFVGAFASSLMYNRTSANISIKRCKVPTLIQTFDAFEKELYYSGIIEYTEPHITKSGMKQYASRGIQEFYYRENNGLKSKGTFVKTTLDYELLEKDEEYRRFVFEELFSKDSIALANVFTNGYVGEPIKDKSGKWTRKIDPEIVADLKSIDKDKTKPIRKPPNILNGDDER